LAKLSLDGVLVLQDPDMLAASMAAESANASA